MGRASIEIEGVRVPWAMLQAIRLLIIFLGGITTNSLYFFQEDHCIFCGAGIPNGCQVCPFCDAQINTPQPAIPAPNLCTRMINWFQDRKH